MFLPSLISAQETVNERKTPDILVVYQQGVDSLHLSEFINLISYYSFHITVKAEEEVTSDHVQNVTHLIYWGSDQSTFRDKVKEFIRGFEGNLLLIGKHSLVPFKQEFPISISTTTQVNGISFNGKSQWQHLSEQIMIDKVIVPSNGATVLLEGWKGTSQSYPVLIQDDQLYYLGLQTFSNEVVQLYIIESLRTFFQVPLSSDHNFVLIIDDVHPLTNVDHLETLTDYLLNENIPFLIAVQPVYYHFERKKNYILSSSPSLIERLQYLQHQGAGILAKGQYKERDLYRSIQELVSHHLPPIGLKINEPTISIKDLSTISQLSSTIISNFHKSSLKGNARIASFERTEPFVLIPKSLYVTELDPLLFSNHFQKELVQIGTLQESVNGIIFPAYLEEELLTTLVKSIYSTFNDPFFDMLQLNHEVNVPYASVQFNKTEGYTVYEDIPLFQKMINRYSLSLIEFILWVVVIIVALTISLFAIHTLRLRIKKRKRLFEERKVNGK
ncbi:DUF2334 domain-containing protein [Bacillus shivajii]|uniref:DUF2334 domain-containing protein n=1 Tax=Bacillus shivajii TaxID=1983719 RepID=UPI001CFA0079|nr:DUF2334 domain-containing protein [Bacillus shivajii]UCZ53581.1 DUF2334 domain-containing protein [Bacillus shivajii]